MKKFTIESWWGAVGAFVVLQCYALLLLYLFSDAVLGWKEASGAKLFDWFFALLVFLLFFCIFSYVQGTFLERVRTFLKDTAKDRLWFGELKSRHGWIKLALLPAWLALYGIMVLRPEWLHLRHVNLAVVVIFQLIHPFAASMAIRFDLMSEVETSPRPVPLKEAASLMAGSAILSALLMGSFILGVPLWVAQLMGFGFLTFGLMVFQLWNMTDGVREWPVTTPPPASDGNKPRDGSSP